MSFRGPTALTASQPSAPSDAPILKRSRRDSILLVTLVLFACVPYLNILFNGFVYDDDTQILKNPYILSFRYVKPIFTKTVWWFTGGQGGVTNYYRPLMTFAYLLCHQVFGFRAWGFHLVSIVLNAGVVCLLFIVTRRLFRNSTLAFLAAALFALHPIHTEAVDWIADVTDLELALFFLLSFWFFLRLGDAGRAPLTPSPSPPRGRGEINARDDPPAVTHRSAVPPLPYMSDGQQESGRGTPWRAPTIDTLPSVARREGFLQAGMGISFALALLSKEPAATLPFLATFFEYTCRRDRAYTSWLVKLQRYAVLWLVLIAYIAFRVRLLGAFVPSPQRARMPYNEVFFSGISMLGGYFEKMVWPLHLCAYYVFPKDLADFLPGFFAGVAAVAVCALLMVYFWRRDRRLCFGFIWFFILLAPVLNPRWMPLNVYSERYLYLPSAGLCWVAAWAGTRLWEAVGRRSRSSRWALAAAACAVAALFAARIVTRNPVWKNDFRFYTQTLAVSPDAVVMHNNLGIYYADQGNLKAAGEQWNISLRLMPTAPFVLNNMGLWNMKLKHYQQAAAFYEQCLALSPRDEAAHEGLGEVYQKLGIQLRAQSELLKAVALAPLDANARVHLGEVYCSEGQYAEGESQFRAAVRVRPTVRGYTGLGAARWAQGDRSGAQRLFAEAEKLDPGDSRPYVMLGVLDAAAGNIPDAIREYQAGLKIDPANSAARAQLARLEHASTAANHVDRREP